MAEGVHVSGINTRGDRKTIGDLLNYGVRVNAFGDLTGDGKVDITSRGDYSGVRSGINVEIAKHNNSVDAAVPLTVNIRKGLFRITKYTGNPRQSTDKAVNLGVGALNVKSAYNSEDITVNFNGQVESIDDGSSGVKVFERNKRGGSTRVTLQSEARIGGNASYPFNDGFEHNVGYGVYIESKDTEDWDDSEEEEVLLNIEAGAEIGTSAVPVAKDGVFVLIHNARAKTRHDVDVKHAGQLYADGHGIWVDHRWKDWNLHMDRNEAYAGGQTGKVAVTVEEGGLVVAGDGKHGIFISTYEYDDGGNEFDITAKKIKTPKVFDQMEDQELIDENAAIAGMYHQRVIIDGEVRGGKNGAVVHLMGGGTITLGAKGRLVPHADGTTSRSVKVSEPANKANKPDLLILLNGNFRGIQKIESVTDRTGSASDRTRFRYRKAGETTYADLSDGTKITLALNKIPAGFYNDWKTQVELTADITEPDNNVFSLNFKSKLSQLTAPDGQRQVAKRGNVYQSLPSVLWDLSDGMERYVPAANASVERNGEAMQSAAGGTAGWVRVEGISGDRRLKKSLGEAVSYRLSSTGFAVGADLPGDGGLTYRAGLHHRQGRAKVTGGGQVKASGLGAGFGVSKRQANGWVLDGWLGATQYDDIQVQSSETIAGQATPFTVNAKTKGTSYALGVGAALEWTLGNATVTQRGSLAWTSVSMKDFKTTYTHRANEDEAGNSLNAMTTTVAETIAMKDGSGLQGGYGVRIDTRYGAGDCCGLFGSLDLRHDFNAKRSISVSSDLRSDTVSTESRPTSLRLGFGGSKSWNEGQATLSGAIYHTTAGHGNSSLSGGVALSFRF